jgi:hypothetical protein
MTLIREYIYNVKYIGWFVGPAVLWMEWVTNKLSDWPNDWPADRADRQTERQTDTLFYYLTKNDKQANQQLTG